VFLASSMEDISSVTSMDTVTIRLNSISVQGLSNVHVVNGLSTPSADIAREEVLLLLLMDDGFDGFIPATNDVGVGVRYAVAVRMEAAFLAAAWAEIALRKFLPVIAEKATAAELIARRVDDAITNFMAISRMRG